MGVSPLFTTGATYLAGDAASGAAGAGAGALGTAAAAAPYVAIPAAIAAYAFSPTVRKYVNGGVSQMGHSLMNGLDGTLDPGQNGNGGFLQGLARMGSGGGGFMSSLLRQAKDPQQNQNPQGQNGSMDFRPPNPIGMIGLGYQTPQGPIPTHPYAYPRGPF